MGTIMIIDDDHSYRDSMAMFLELEAHTIIEADNGMTGLQMIRDYVPNLILCDVDMPIMGGIELLRAVKADPIFANIPFVLVSGSTDEQTIQLSQGLGVEAYLIKPVAMPQFLATINHFLNPIMRGIVVT